MSSITVALFAGPVCLHDDDDDAPTKPDESSSDEEGDREEEEGVEDDDEEELEKEIRMKNKKTTLKLDDWLVLKANQQVSVPCLFC